MEDKQTVYDLLKGVSYMHSADDLVDLNGHTGRHIDGFKRVHGVYDVGQRIFVGRMLLEFCLEKELCVSDTWLK